jgi:hypothetical protein
MLKVFRNNAVRVHKNQLGKLERDSVLRLVLTILPLIPLKASRHGNAGKKHTYKNMACKVLVIRRAKWGKLQLCAQALRLHGATYTLTRDSAT